jgi:hypothetical protein
MSATLDTSVYMRDKEPDRSGSFRYKKMIFGIGSKGCVSPDIHLALSLFSVGYVRLRTGVDFPRFRRNNPASAAPASNHVAGSGVGATLCATETSSNDQ